MDTAFNPGSATTVEFGDFLAIALNPDCDIVILPFTEMMNTFRSNGFDPLRSMVREGLEQLGSEHPSELRQRIIGVIVSHDLQSRALQAAQDREAVEHLFAPTP